MSLATRMRGAPSTEKVEVTFDYECDEFTVPEWPGLWCGATYEVRGEVSIDHSGDDVTPDGAPSAEVYLLDVKSYSIYLGDVQLPEWLEFHLATEWAGEMDAAFLAKVGHNKLQEKAIEKALNI